MLFRNLGILGKRFAQRFLPSKISGLQLWLDGTDETTLNAKMGADFNAPTNEYLSSASTDFDKGDEDFSWGAWVSMETIASLNDFIGLTGNIGGYGYLLYYQTTFKVFISSDGTNITVADSGVSTSTDTWVFVVGVYDATNDLIKISVNGANFVTASHAGGGFAGTLFTLGSNGNSSRWLNGQMDGAFFYDKALTIAQVGSLYNGGSGVAYADLTADDLVSLVDFWQLNELIGNRSGELGHTLTDNNSVLSALGKIQEPITANDYVWRWTDKSTNGYNFDQATGSSQPQYISSGFGTESKPHLLYNGVLDELGGNDLGVLSSGSTQILVLDTSVTGFVATHPSSTELPIIVDTSASAVSIGVAQTYQINGVDVTLTTRQDADDVVVGVGAVIVTMKTSLSQDFSAFGIGTYVPASWGINGKVVECLVYNRELTDSELTQIANYLNNKYGIY